MIKKEDVIKVSLNGFTDLPNGTVANIVTTLEMLNKPSLRPTTNEGCQLSRLHVQDLSLHQQLFCVIGEEWLWFFRALAPEEDLKEALENPAIEIYTLQQHHENIGVLEVNFTDPANVKLVLFGLLSEVIGTHASRWLMNETLDMIWSRRATKRLWVQTCTIDHPAALPFYMRTGFKPIKRQIEIAPDPRLSGHLRLDAAPHHPIIR